MNFNFNFNIQSLVQFLRLMFYVYLCGFFLQNGKESGDRTFFWYFCFMFSKTFFMEKNSQLRGAKNWFAFFKQLNNDCMYLYLNSDLLLSNKLNHPFYFRGAFVRFRRIVQWIYTNFNKGAEVNASNPKRNVVHFRIITKWIVRWGLYDINTSSSSNSWGCKPQKTSIIIMKMVHMHALKQWERIDTLTYKEMMYLCYATSNR